MVFRKSKTMRHYRVTQAGRKKVPKGKCPFCDMENKKSEVLLDNKYFNLIINVFPYDIWDDQEVTEHLMLVPKRHIHSISEFDSEEAKIFYILTSEYESKGYSVYYRSKDNVTKSVEHQHTHLFKLSGKRSKFTLCIKKPYILWWK